MAQAGITAERRAAEKRADIDVAARALFEATRNAIEELESVAWDTLPDVGSSWPSMKCKDYYRGEVSPTVEALWRAGRLVVSAAPPVRGDKWERTVSAGVKAGMTREASEAHADAREKLVARIEKLEHERTLIRQANAAYKAEHKAELKAMTAYQRDLAMPFRSYVLTNLSGNLNRARKRLEAMS